MITCPKCSKENQDHYKFCLGCGAELPRDASPRKFAPGTPPHGVPAVVRGMAYAEEAVAVGMAPHAPAVAPPPPPMPMPAAPPMPAPVVAPPLASVESGPPILCAQCEHPNPGGNKFCASCGFKLAKPAAPAVPAPPPAVGGLLLTALRADGSEAGSFTLPPGGATIGRDTGAIFAGDSYLSPRHATFVTKGSRILVKDESSLNGVYRKLRVDEPVLIEGGDIFRIGQEIVRLERLVPLPPTADGVERLGSPAKGYVARIALVTGRDATGNAFPIPDTGLHLGRERGDVLFPEDGYVSGLHCQIAYQNGQFYLTDLGSSNGTFLRISAETELQSGDVLLMGQQLFRVTV